MLLNTLRRDQWGLIRQSKVWGVHNNKKDLELLDERTKVDSTPTYPNKKTCLSGVLGESVSLSRDPTLDPTNYMVSYNLQGQCYWSG